MDFFRHEIFLEKGQRIAFGRPVLRLPEDLQESLIVADYNLRVFEARRPLFIDPLRVDTEWRLIE